MVGVLCPPPAVTALGQTTTSVCLRHFFCITVTAPTEIHTLSLHDALPILPRNKLSVSNMAVLLLNHRRHVELSQSVQRCDQTLDRKSTRLNSSHRCISYAVFCLKKKTGMRLPNTGPIDHLCTTRGAPRRPT